MNGDQHICFYKGFTIQRLGHQEVAAMQRLQKEVVLGLPDNTLFVSDGEDYFHTLLEEGGEIYGAYFEGKLTAYSVLARPGTGEGNLGREFGVTEEELPKVWVLDSTVVHKSARGQGLQRYFSDLREQRARQLGGLYLYSTAHPDNEASVRNLQAAGLEVQFTRVMYGGVLRHCLAKRL